MYYICVLSFRLDKLGMNIPRFDFRCAGVTSVSADLHKFGYTPKVVYNFYQLLKLTTCILTTTELSVLIAFPIRAELSLHKLQLMERQLRTC